MVIRFLCAIVIFFFKQKTAYEMRISDWSSDVCSSDLCALRLRRCPLCCACKRNMKPLCVCLDRLFVTANRTSNAGRAMLCTEIDKRLTQKLAGVIFRKRNDWRADIAALRHAEAFRSEEHTSELQSLMRNSYAVFCLKKKRKEK